MNAHQIWVQRCNEEHFQLSRCSNVLENKTIKGICKNALLTRQYIAFGLVQSEDVPCRESYICVFWTQALSAWPLPEAQSPRPVSWHVSLPPPAKEECRCPRGKWKHLVLARPVHVSARPHELAGDVCTEKNQRPQRWPTSFSSTQDTTQKHGWICFWLRKHLGESDKNWPESSWNSLPCTCFFILTDQFHSVWSVALQWVYKIPLLVNINIYFFVIFALFWLSVPLFDNFQKYTWHYVTTSYCINIWNYQTIYIQVSWGSIIAIKSTNLETVNVFK